MSEHFESVVDYIMSDDNSELGQTKAELAYALHCLEREIAIAQRAQAENGGLVKALTEISELYSGGHGWRAKEIAKAALVRVGQVRTP